VVEALSVPTATWGIQKVGVKFSVSIYVRIVFRAINGEKVFRRANQGIGSNDISTGFTQSIRKAIYRY